MDPREKESDSRDASAEEFLRRAIEGEPGGEAVERMRGALAAFRGRLDAHPYARRLDGKGGRSRGARRLALPAVFAGTGVAAAVLVAFLVLGGGRVTWADVAATFASVRSFNAVVYIKEDALSEPGQMEVWMGEGGRMRVRKGAQVLFSDGAGAVKAFDVKTRAEAEPDGDAMDFVKMLSGQRTFSLDTLLKTFSAVASEMTPVPNSGAALSRDMVVFDVQSKNTPEWMRIWALRESRLPVRVQVYDPRNGQNCDVLFDYSRQPREFFDPDAFSDELRKHSSRANLAYALLKDPGGRAITPEDVFEESSGYHVPEIEMAGFTEDGVLWVVSTHSANHGPTGYFSFGFASCADDLGRTYVRMNASHRPDTDTGYNMFVPVTYPFDKRRPGKVTLTAVYDYPYPPTTIGVAEVTDFRPPDMMPRDFDESWRRQALGFATGYYLQRSDWAEVERRMATVSGEPEETKDAFWRERTRLSMFMARGERDAAAALAHRLLPIQEYKYSRWQHGALTPEVFSDYICAIAAAGALSEARDVYRRVMEIKPEMSDSLSSRVRKQMEETAQYDRRRFLVHLAEWLSNRLFLSVDEIGYVLGVEVLKDETLTSSPAFQLWDWRPEYAAAGYDPWRKRLAEIAAYYRSHSYPQAVECLTFSDDIDWHRYNAALPGVDAPRVERFSGALGQVLRRGLDDSGSVVIPDDLAGIQVRYDVAYMRGVSEDARKAAVLDALGLEMVDETAERRVWVARYDGRPLKPADDVHAPVSRDSAGGRVVPGMEVGADCSPGFSMKDLLSLLASYQNRGRRSDLLTIVDETGIDSKPSPDAPHGRILCRESIYWGGEGAMEVAREWFKKEFGVTLTEEVRQMPVKVVRRMIAAETPGN